MSGCSGSSGSKGAAGGSKGKTGGIGFETNPVLAGNRRRAIELQAYTPIRDNSTISDVERDMKTWSSKTKQVVEYMEKMLNNQDGDLHKLEIMDAKKNIKLIKIAESMHKENIQLAKTRSYNQREDIVSEARIYYHGMLERATNLRNMLLQHQYADDKITWEQFEKQTVKPVFDWSK